jgi:hypothetical protein
MVNMNIAAAISREEFNRCFRCDDTPEAHYFNYVLIFAFYVLDWVISERMSEKIDVNINMAAFLEAARSGNIDRIRDFFVSISNGSNEHLIYDFEDNSVYMGSDSGLGALKDPVGKVKGVYGSAPKFESVAVYLLNGSDVFGSSVSYVDSLFKDNVYLSVLCKPLYNLTKRRTVEKRIKIYTVGSNVLRYGGKSSYRSIGLGLHYATLPEHLIDNSLLEQGLNYLVDQKLITIEQGEQIDDHSLAQTNRPIREPSVQDSSNHCDSVKEKLIERPYIAFFIIAAAALLACGAVALTTYFHVGTTLMLAAGFIPFLNFLGGFQISLLLGVVSIATFSAGGIYAIAKTSTCCDECCNKEQCSEYASSSSDSDDDEPIVQDESNPNTPNTLV